MKEYALYKGEKLLAIGTTEEIAEELNVKEETVRYYGTPSQKKRSKKDNNCRILVALDGEEKHLKTKTCTSCKKKLPATKEYFHESGSIHGDGLRNKCKDCRNKEIKVERAKPKISLKDLDADFKLGQKYKVKVIRKSRLRDYFEGELIQITKDHITLKNKLGVCESFKKIDFKIKDYSIQEVI